MLRVISQRAVDFYTITAGRFSFVVKLLSHETLRRGFFSKVLADVLFFFLTFFQQNSHVTFWGSVRWYVIILQLFSPIV